MTDRFQDTLHDINVGKIKTSHIYYLIDAYYEMIFGGVKEQGSDVWDELQRPLHDRCCAIERALYDLLEHGYDVNEPGESINALMLAVMNADEPMVAFLLAHGADIFTWPYMGELPKELQGNFYLEDIDAQYMDACSDHDEKMKEVLHTLANTIVKMSGIRKYAGLCLCVDDNGTVSLTPLRMRY